jgi:hypothetical protein
MDNRAYLVRYFIPAAVLLWASVAVVIIVAQRPEPVAEAPNHGPPISAVH